MYGEGRPHAPSCGMCDVDAQVLAGTLLAHPLPADERLRAYASWCNAVEGNTTFYATPARDTVASWARQTDPDFRFVIKLPKLDHPRAPAHRRRRGAPGLPGRDRAARPAAHALWIQLPGSFGPADLPDARPLPAPAARAPTGTPWRSAIPRSSTTPARPGCWRDVLTARGRRVDPVRHHRVLPEPADQRRGTGRVDQEAAHAPPVARADRPADRPLPRPRRHRTRRSRAGSTGSTWSPSWLREGRSPTVFVHTPDNADAPALARRFHDEVRARVPELEALPEPIAGRAADPVLTLAPPSLRFIPRR